MLNDPVVADVYVVNDQKKETISWTINKEHVSGLMSVHVSFLGLSDKEDYEVSVTITDSNRKSVVKIDQLSGMKIKANGSEIEPHRFIIQYDTQLQLPLSSGLYKVQCRLLKNKKVVSNGKAFFYCKQIANDDEK